MTTYEMMTVGLQIVQITLMMTNIVLSVMLLSLKKIK